MNKKFTSVIITFIIVFSLTAGVSAAVSKKLYENMSLTALLKMPDEETYILKINALDKENNAFDIEDLEQQIEYYTSQMNNLKIKDQKYYEYKLQLLSLEKDLFLAEFEDEYFNEKDKLDKKALNFNLQSKYYDLCLLKSKLAAANIRLDYLNKSMDVEHIKFSQERSTEIDVKLKEIDVKSAENTVKQIKNEMDNVNRLIANMLNQYKAENYSFSLEIPTEINEYSKFEKTVNKRFFEKNYDIKRVNNQIEAEETYLEEIEKIYGKDSDTYKKLSNSIEKSKLELEIKEENFKIFITEKFNTYESALTNYRTSCEYR